MRKHALNLAEVLVELQLRAGDPANVRDPLAAIRVYLAEQAGHEEARVLRLVIGGLMSGRVSLRVDDLAILTPAGAQLAAALVDARLSGVYADAEWRSAALSLVSPSH